MTEDLTKKYGSFNSEHCRERDADLFIIKQVHVKSINVTIKRVTKCIQRIEDMDIFYFFYYRYFLKILLGCGCDKLMTQPGIFF